MIHSLGYGVVQTLQKLHPVFLATLRKSVEGLFRSAPLSKASLHLRRSTPGSL
jgi:hypothetical protein